MTMKNELIRAAERAHYIMQLSSYFTELTDSLGVRFAYTCRLSDAWYNQAYDLHCESAECDVTVDRVEQYFSTKERLPSIYITPASSPKDIKEVLERRGYARFDQEAWMFYDQSKPFSDANRSVEITNVRSQSDLLVFSDVYRRGLPGPEVGKYIQSVIEGFKSNPPLVSIWYFLAYIKGEPAGMASLLHHGSFAGVYAVATVPEHRREGCAKALTSRLIETARSAGAEHIFLQTGAGDEGEATFERLGFKTAFVRDGYTRADAISDMQHG